MPRKSADGNVIQVRAEGRECIDNNDGQIIRENTPKEQEGGADRQTQISKKRRAKPPVFPDQECLCTDYDSLKEKGNYRE